MFTSARGRVGLGQRDGVLLHDTITPPPLFSFYITSGNRTHKPQLTSSDVPGRVGTGAPAPLPFSRHSHDVDNPLSPVLAIARVGGHGGQVYVYSEENLYQSSSGSGATLAGSYQSASSWGGGGRRWF